MLLKDYKLQHTGGIRRLSRALCQESVDEGFLIEIKHPNISLSEGTVHLYFQKGTGGALLRVAEKKGLIISTGYRTLAQQFILKQNLTSLVAPVGRSDHGAGRSVDIVNWSDVRSEMFKQGFTQPYKTDLVHFDWRDRDVRASAARAFQRYWNKYNSNKLAVDGAVGKQTLAALANTPVHGFHPYTSQEIQRAFTFKDFSGGEALAFQKLYNQGRVASRLKEDGDAGVNTLFAYSQYVWPTP